MMRPIIQIIEQETAWSLSALEKLALESQVKLNRRGSLIQLDYGDDIHVSKWNEFNRQCRGLIVDLSNRRLVAYPFDRFFNLNSHEESKFENLPITYGYEIATKLDGSMVILYEHMGDKKFATRSSFDNEQTRIAEELLNTRYQQLQKLNSHRYTFIFELISPKNRIIIDYQHEDLVLIGVRDLNTNELLPYSQVVAHAQEFAVTAIVCHDLTIEGLINSAGKDELDVLEEGWVVRFKNGLFVKIKTWQYLANVHIQKLGLGNKQLIERFSKMTPEQWIQFVKELPSCVQKEVEEFGSELDILCDQFIQELRNNYAEYESIEDQKTFAIAIQKNIDRKYWDFYFRLRKGDGNLKAVLRRKIYDILPINRETEIVTPEMMKEWAFTKKD